LSALMLDSKSTFDTLVARNAATPEQAQRILDNTFYRNISGALGGTQEYMAMEKLHELHAEGGFELIVVDTPPTRHALDFLDAPRRLTRLLDNRIFRVLITPTRASLKIASAAVQTFLRTVARVVGSEVIKDVIAFFRAFEGMEEGFRARAQAVDQLLTDSDTAFVLVTSPRRDAVREAEFFASRLGESGLEVSALVVNRVHPDFGEGRDADALSVRAADLAARAATAPPDARDAIARMAARYANLAEYASLAKRERVQLDDAGTRFGAAAVAFVPSLTHDVVDFQALDTVAAHLLGTGRIEPLG
jgi:anion-transporting  ArsA/GET3 family ATPase